MPNVLHKHFFLKKFKVEIKKLSNQMKLNLKIMLYLEDLKFYNSRFLLINLNLFVM